jgi:Restriction endonuclease
MDAFMDRLVDWLAFERFVRDLYAEDSELVVEHNVTEVGKSGARRQIDVKFTHKVRSHTYVTLVECKHWKSNVNRQRIDELASSLEDLNASKGVMFTTTGYEAGAETYARHKGIDLFLVRDLTDEEWGLPGRVIWFYMHYYGAQIKDFTNSAELLATVPNPPSTVNLQLIFRPDGSLDEALTLRSLTGAGTGPNLMTLIGEAQQRAMGALADKIELFADGEDGARLVFAVPLELDLSALEHRHLVQPYGFLKIDRITMHLLVTVTQSRFEFDRGRELDLALAVENYVTRQRSVVVRHPDSRDMAIHDLQDDGPSEQDRSEALMNGTLLRIFLEPWVQPDPVVGNPKRTSGIVFAPPDWTVKPKPDGETGPGKDAPR